MRIAQVAPLYTSVPPKHHGGTERVVSYLTEELVNQGHEVTLFASGDSSTSARLIAPGPWQLSSQEDGFVPEILLGQHALLMEQVFRSASEFDIVHFHTGYLHVPVLRRREMRHVTTLHWRLDVAGLRPVYEEFSGAPVVSISEAQRNAVPWLNWQGTIYHGLPQHLYTFREQRGTYLAFLGRISPEKGVVQAIEIARRANMPIKIAANVANREYFEHSVKPMLEDPLVEYVGEIDDAEKNGFLANAYALLFPIEWPEPFGLVMIEAMACGTPVIAFRRGSVPEVIDNGVTGFSVEDIEEAVEAIEMIAALSRRRCREAFEERFTACRMAQDYLTVYTRLVERKTKSASVR